MAKNLRYNTFKETYFTILENREDGQEEIGFTYNPFTCRCPDNCYFRRESDGTVYAPMGDGILAPIND
jgi:hypothetical protein